MTTSILRVWIDPAAHTNGYTKEMFVQGVVDAFAMISAVSDFRIKIVGQLKPGDTQIKTKELYLGNLQHARGWYDPKTPKTIWVHSGQISAGRHSGRLGPKDKPLENYQIIYTGTLHRIIAHERLHQIGWSHSSDAKCIMYAAVGPSLCPAEVNKLVARYGKPKTSSAEFDVSSDRLSEDVVEYDPIELIVEP